MDQKEQILDLSIILYCDHYKLRYLIDAKDNILKNNKNAYFSGFISS